MTEAQVQPASSASAPEGFLTSQDNPNGNEYSTSSTSPIVSDYLLIENISPLLFIVSCLGEIGLRRTSSVPDQRSLLDKRPDPVREVLPDMLVKIAA